MWLPFDPTQGNVFFRLILSVMLVRGNNQFAISLTNLQRWNRIRTMKLKLAIWAAVLAGLTTGRAAAAGGLDAEKAAHTFVIGTNDFLLDGQRIQIRCGEIHAARVPKEYWRHRLQMAKAMGLNTVSTYLFWNLQEPKPGEFNWSGQADTAEFCRIAQEEGIVGDSASWPVFLRRMGNGRHAMVALEER